MNIGAVIVAAGMSTRMKKFKQLMKIGDMTMAERVVTNFQRAGISDIVMVTGYQSDLLIKSEKKLGITFLKNEEYETTEMLDSAKIGLDYLQKRCDKILFCPVDIPLFSVNTVKKLIVHDEDFVVPVYNGRRGHPIMLDSTLVNGILAFEGERGLKGALDHLGAVPYEVQVDDEGIMMDTDTEEDYLRMIEKHNSTLMRPQIRLSLAEYETEIIGREISDDNHENITACIHRLLDAGVSEINISQMSGGAAMKKKWSADRIFMLVMGMLMQAVFLFPWIRISGHGYNALSYLIHVIAGGGKASLFQKDLCSFSMLNGLAWKELQPIAIVFVVQMLLLTAAQGCCLVHMILVIRKNKNKQVLYYIAGITATCTAFLYSQGPILATGDLLTEGYTFVVMCCIGIEIVGVCMIESWEDFSADYNQSKQRDAEAKKEKKERTQFEGKYSNLFLKIIWKNFRYNWHSYRIFVFVSTFSVTLIFAGFGMWEILKSAHAHENLLMGQGLGTILLGFLAAIIVTAVFLIISVLLFYLKNHVKNYGIFVTLGMRKRTLYCFMGIELVSCMLISLILGIVFGNVLVFICRAAIGNMPDVNLVMGHISYVSFVLTIVCTLAIFLLSVLLSREVYIDTGASVSGNKAVEREKMPGRWAKYGLIPGALFFVYGLLKFASRGAFEGTKTLIIFFIGVYLLLRNGMVLYLKNRNEHAYYGSLLRNNHFYYRCRTTFRYLFFFTVIHVCVLFVFAKGMISSVIADRMDQQFPYDYVCMATEDDEEIFEKIAEDYDADITIYPMVRVVNVDNTTKTDNYMSSMFPQGQQIGISESTYRELCQMRGWECDDLNLADDGSEIAVIYQQDQSVNAHPLDYYMGSAKPYLHIGQPIQYYEFVDREEIFPPRKIKDSRTGSLIGSFRQGKHENIVVFSDVYFEKVKDDWQKTDCVMGMALEGEAITDVTVHHWPTQLVLINVPEENREAVEMNLDQFNRNHAYDNHIDSSVLSYYSKADLTDERSTEKFMHIAVNGFIMVILSIVSLVLMYLKMESEMDEKRRQYDFLRCMGMKRTDRIRLMKKEREDFLVIPVILATVISIVFTLIIWRLRQYTSKDCVSYLEILAGVYVMYIAVQVIGTKCFEWFCRKKVEG